MSKTRKVRRVFPVELKMGLVAEYLSVSQSRYSFCKKHHLDNGDFSRWLRTFAPESEAVSKMGKKEKESEEVKELKRQLRQKEVELGKERMRADFYETMVSVAEEQFNITIRKKAGTKQ